MTYRPALPLVLGLIAGILIEHWMAVPLWVIGIVFGTLIALTVWQHRAACLLLALMAVVGYVSADVQSRPYRNDIRFLPLKSRDVTLEGIVLNDVEHRSVLKTRKTVFEFKLEKIKLPSGWRDVRGIVMGNLFRPEDLRFGDRLRLTGKLHRPYDSGDSSSSYSDYLKRRGVDYLFSVKKNAEVKILQRRVFSPARMLFRDLHRSIGEMFDEYLPPQEAGIMRAMMTGDRSDIPPHVKQLFLETGTIHIVAISGLNMAVIAGMFLFIAGLLPLGLRGRMIFCAVMVIAYACITDGEASIVRAAVMACIFLLSFVLEREQDTWNTLSFSAIVILIYAPWQLFDIGFQLTYLCVAVILAVHPALAAIIEKTVARAPLGLRTVLKGVLEAAGISLAIWIFIGGLTAYYFRMVTPVTILANVPIIPLGAALVVLGMMMCLSSVMAPVLCPIWALYTHLCLNFMIWILHILRYVPAACFHLNALPIVFVVIYYSALALLVGGIYAVRRKPA